METLTYRYTIQQWELMSKVSTRDISHSLRTQSGMRLAAEVPDHRETQLEGGA